MCYADLMFLIPFVVMASLALAEHLGVPVEIRR
jgi:hypothetical protein